LFPKAHGLTPKVPKQTRGVPAPDFQSVSPFPKPAIIPPVLELVSKMKPALIPSPILRGEGIPVVVFLKLLLELK
jgi:hypothetical protein